MTDDTVCYARHFASGLPPAKSRETPARRYNFGSGHNDPDVVPVTGLAEVAARVIEREGRSLAVYELGGSPLGHQGLREVVVSKLGRTRGITVTADDVLITSGSLQGIDLVNKLLLERGDVVVAEEHSYVGALSRLAALGVEVVPAPLDHEGIRLDALDEVLGRLAKSGRPAKYVYTIPTVQNPTGAIMGMARRQGFVEIARRHDTPIFEDECYADLVWEGESPPALYALAPEQVLHIGSFAKTLAPALRLGYLVAPWQALGRILALKSDGGTSALDQMIAAAFLEDHFADHVAKLSARLRHKMTAMVDAVGREFGTAVEVVAPPGGLYIWVKFPESVDVERLVEPAAQAGVAFNPGQAWSVNPAAGAHHMRLCFGLATVEEIEAGIKVLAQVCFEATGVPARSGNVANAPAA
jgi:2-aminoadipate transaminase